MNFAPHIAARVLNTPLMILPEKLAVIASVLKSRIGIEADGLKALVDMAPGIPQGSQFIGEFAPTARGGRKPYRTTPGGLAIVPVIGSLVRRGGPFDAVSGVMSYDKIRFLLSSAAEDPDVQAIVMDIDSPGGEAVGCFEVADTVRAIGRQKTVIAVAGGLCASAAYAIASAATRVIVSPSAVVGSVGVVLLHVDFSRQIDRQGITPTLIHAGARKIDGHPYAPLEDEVLQRMQDEVDRFMDLFVSTVAKGRSKMKPAEVRATEAQTYIGLEAIDVGFADEVGTIESVVETYANLYAPSQPLRRISHQS